jgi:hypothetical protein
MSSSRVETLQRTLPQRGVELTPLGFVSTSGLEELRAFGDEAERLEYPSIDVGGFIVPGRAPASLHKPGSGVHDYAIAREGDREIGRQAQRIGPREWEGAASAVAAPGEAPHAVRHGLTHANLDLSGLVAFHPLTRMVANTERAVYLNIPLGLFHELPIRIRLTLEIPLGSRARLSRPGVLPTPVPDVRAWAVWDSNVSRGMLLTSHHQYPDHAICACMPIEWILGVHQLRDYVAFCALWAAKRLHELLLGHYPGRQHYGAFDRVRRDRRSEYCGCGGVRRYAACCRTADQELSPHDRWRDAAAARDQYLRELAWQRRCVEPPYPLLQLGLRRAA